MFVDAVVPPRDGPVITSPHLVALLDTLPLVEGRLPPWHEWWPAELMAALVPDAAARRALTAEVPAVPRSFYDDPVPAPAEWSRQPAAYLRLSAAYDADLARAERWGWPAVRLSGRHLDLFTRPAFVADHVRRLVGRLDAPNDPLAHR